LLPSAPPEVAKKRGRWLGGYRSEFCQAAIQWGSEGKSLTWIAAEIGDHQGIRCMRVRRCLAVRQDAGAAILVTNGIVTSWFFISPYALRAPSLDASSGLVWLLIHTGLTCTRRPRADNCATQPSRQGTPTWPAWADAVLC
jgi:hypothetical protein